MVSARASGLSIRGPIVPGNGQASALGVFRAGGDDDALTGEDGRDKVGEGFADACAGLDDEVFAVGERGFDSLGHFELAGAVLVVGMPLGRRAVAGEELAQDALVGGDIWGLD